MCEVQVRNRSSAYLCHIIFAKIWVFCDRYIEVKVRIEKTKNKQTNKKPRWNKELNLSLAQFLGCKIDVVKFGWRTVFCWFCHFVFA